MGHPASADHDADGLIDHRSVGQCGLQPRGQPLNLRDDPRVCRRPEIVVVLDFRAFVPSGRPDLTLLGPAVGTDLSPARRAGPSVVLMESVMLDLACCVNLP